MVTGYITIFVVFPFIFIIFSARPTTGMNGCEGIGSCPGVEGIGVASSTFSAALQFLLHSQCLITEPWPTQASLQNETSVDIIIVGSGTAGSALAARLAETNLTVLVLEAGDDPPVESIVPGFKISLLRGQYDWNFTTVDDHYSSQELANHQQRLRAGKLLGGTGSINGMIYARSFPADYDQWADILGDSNWNFNNVLSYFKKTENMTDESILINPASQQYHGYDGEITVSGPNEKTFIVSKLLEAFGELGFDIIEDRNNPESIGAYHQTFTVKDGKRQSTLTAMLNKVAYRENIHIMKNAFVKKVLIKDNIAYGVKVSIGDDEWQFYANKEVIVSAGVYNTPKLLMLSGIGPRKHLENHNIDVVKELPVGRNLQDHVTYTKYIAADKGSCADDKHYEAIKYLYNRTGSLAVPNKIGVDYALKDSIAPQVPDFSFFPECVPVASNYLKECLHSFDYTQDTCSYLDSINKNYELFPIYLSMRKPKSRGRVTLASADPKDKPIVYTGVFENLEDLEGFPEVVEVLTTLANTSYFRSKNAFMVDLGLESCNDMEWPEHVKCEALSLAMSDGHGVGTAAMGSVLDSRMRVRGLRKLRVVDASVMPTVPRTNTNSVVIMIAEKAADFIKNEYGLA